MNKRVWIIVAACLLSAILVVLLIPRSIQLKDYRGVTVGTPAERITQLVPESHLFQIYRYSFYTNNYGHPVVAVRNTKTGLIETIKCFDRSFVSNTPESFDSIQPGMDMFDVVSRVGLPFACRTSGVFSLDFMSSDNKVYVIVFKNCGAGKDVVDVVIAPKD